MGAFSRLKPYRCSSFLRNLRFISSLQSQSPTALQFNGITRRLLDWRLQTKRGPASSAGNVRKVSNSTAMIRLKPGLHTLLAFTPHSTLDPRLHELVLDHH